MRMRAAVFCAPHQPLAVEPLEIGDPLEGEVAVRLEASGVCHSDLHVVDGEWPETPPLVLGHEGCGIVEALGEGVSGIAVGDRVVLSWYAPCGRCRMCASGRPWLCEGNRADDSLMPDGSTRLSRPDGQPVRAYLAVGSFAERAVVPASAAVPICDGVPAEVGALIGCGVATGVGAVLNTARVPAGASVAVIGCGGVGLSVVMGAALAGAHPIVAVDVRDDKLDLAGTVGATNGVRAEDHGALSAALPAGADFVFEAIGHPRTIEHAVNLTGRGGTTVLVGMPDGRLTASFSPLSLSADGRSIVGCTYGSTRPQVDFPRLARLYVAGRLPIDRLITHRIELDGVNDAFARMRGGEGARTVIRYPSGDRPAASPPPSRAASS
jgi:S-(hydroxymethyl)glutathione dehydrogenase / alcohol dehydrogenase